MVVARIPGIDFDGGGPVSLEGEIEVIQHQRFEVLGCRLDRGPPSSFKGLIPVKLVPGCDDEFDRLRCAARREMIVDPDGAVVRAGLVQLRRPAWLCSIPPFSTQPVIIAARCCAFEVLEQRAFDERRLRQVLSAPDRAAEILVRGARSIPIASAATAPGCGQDRWRWPLPGIAPGPEPCDRPIPAVPATGRLAAVTPKLRQRLWSRRLDDALSDSDRSARCCGPGGPGWRLVRRQTCAGLATRRRLPCTPGPGTC